MRRLLATLALILAPALAEAAPPAPRVTRSSRTRRRLMLAGGVLAAIAAASPAAADPVTTWLQDNGVLMVEVEQLQVTYQGKLYTWDQIADLQRQGRAQVTVADPASSVQGRAHAFDTPGEADAWACVHIPSRSCPTATTTTP